jgi:hypothetical protein
MYFLNLFSENLLLFRIVIKSIEFRVMFPKFASYRLYFIPIGISRYSLKCDSHLKDLHISLN